MIVPYVLRRVPRMSDKSLSQHIAKDPRTIRFAQVMFVLEALLVATWYFGWYRQTHDVFLLQDMLLIAVCILAALAGLVPHIEGERAGTLHNYFAWTYAYLLPLLLIACMYTVESPVAKIIIGLCTAWQIYTAGLYWFKPSTRKYFLNYQLSYIAVFAFALIVATYIR